MTEEAISYNKYEIQSLLNIDHATEFRLERIFRVYKQVGGEHFYYNILKKIQFPEITAKSTYTKYYTKPGDMWSLISYAHYGRTDLWWLIAMLNNISNTFIPPPPGTYLKIPVPGYVRSVVDSIKAQI